MSFHPPYGELALFAGGDSPLVQRWKLRWHLRQCERCEREVQLLQATRLELKQQARSETLSGFEAIADWAYLEREMEGNIVVGVAAARCIGKSHGRRRLLKTLAVAAGAAVLSVMGWVSHVPAEQTARLYSVIKDGIFGGADRNDHYPVLKTQPDGIVVGSQYGSLTILHPATAVVSASGKTSVEARYIDEETGQVTINSVYGQ